MTTPRFRAIVGAELGGQSVLIADSETGCYRPSDHRVTSGAAFDNLFRADGELVGWNLDPTINTWANDLPVTVRVRLCASLSASWGPYTAQFIPGRFLSVSKRGGQRSATNHRPAVYKRTVYDLAAFWPRGAQLAAVAASWGVLVPSIVQAGDAARPSEFDGWTFDAIAEWAVARAGVIRELAERLASRLDELGLLPERWHGVGALASVLLDDAGANRWVAAYRPARQPECDGTPLLPIFLRAYYGGRVETTVAGSLDCTVWRLDLRSAYAWALSWLGPVGFRWQHVTAFDPRVESRMAVYRVSWDTRQAWLSPLPYRESERHGIIYPQIGEGWYWWPEVRAALARHGDEITVHEGYVSPASSLRPLLTTMADLYQLRRELGDDDPIVPVLKGAGNSVYGKLAQTVSANGHPGRYYNPALAGWITSAVRARLLPAFGPDDIRVAAIMTDGILHTDEPPASLLSSGMGGWRVERYDGAELVIPGLYRLLRDGRTAATATTGISQHVDFDWLLGELTARNKATVTGRWFVPHILADMWPDQWDHARCRWQATTSTLNPWVLARKREGVAQLAASFDWRTDLKVLGPYREIGEHLSAPYAGPPAWSRTGFDPLYEAARAALSQAG